MQQAVKGVEEHLMGHRNGAESSLAAGVWDADVDFTAERTAAGIHVEGEREDIGGAGEVHELAVERGHAGVVHEDDGEVAEGAGDQARGAAEVAANEGDIGLSGWAGESYAKGLAH